MAVTPKKTEEVLAAARKELQAQLAAVRQELGRLTTEEKALTQALASLNGHARARVAEADGGGTRSARSSRGNGSSRRRRARISSKSTADRLEELCGLLADGPKTRNELAAALDVSPARVQQLLARLGSRVSWRPDPGQRQGKLWSLVDNGSGKGAAKQAPKRKAAAASKRSGSGPATK